MESQFKDDLKEILLKKKESEKSKKNITYKIIALSSFATICIVTFLYFSTSLFSSSPITGPYGKIHSPAAGSVTGKEVSVTAETRNLEPGQYVWLVVDKPDIGLCWPKGQRLASNKSFTTVIYEEGKKEPYTLSLYVVSKTINDQWQEWLDAAMHGGLSMPPDKRRLDSVKLILGE